MILDERERRLKTVTSSANQLKDATRAARLGDDG